ncbi:MAG: hypothetical protein JO001_07370 [Alphaproteobacteria bacterium]|nr:hypothetical protein [Alphaproteobacteria bacterium]
MFLQLVTPPLTLPFTAPVIQALSAQARANADSLFLYHPLQVSALVETFWRNRYNAWSAAGGAASAFVAWPEAVTQALLTDAPNTGYILGYDPSTGFPNTSVPASNPTGQAFMPAGETFTPALAQPGISGLGQSNYDHLIYAYLIENTRIYDIFAKVLETYMFTEQLPSPSFAAQQFLRSTEYLMYSDGLPTMVWTTQSRLRRDEIANRLTLYYWMFGLDLSHAPELAIAHPYNKPDASDRDFIPTFEVLASEVWRGIENAKNTSGANATDDEAIATAARRIYDMMATRQLNDNLRREGFRAVCVMSWLHLAVMYDSAIVLALNASASSPEQRLQKIAERVGMSAHTRAKPLFDLSQAFSSLMQSIETGLFNTPGAVATLYTPPSTIEANAEIVIDQYSLATGRDLKAPSVTVTDRATTAPRAARPMPRLPTPSAPPAARALPTPSRGPQPGLHRPNGHAP